MYYNMMVNKVLELNMASLTLAWCGLEEAFKCSFWAVASILSFFLTVQNFHTISFTTLHKRLILFSLFHII